MAAIVADVQPRQPVWQRNGCGLLALLEHVLFGRMGGGQADSGVGRNCRPEPPKAIPAHGKGLVFLLASISPAR